MTPQPRVSVIVLGHNERRLLDGCFTAIFDQTLPRDDYHVIYADNGSMDDSLSVVRERFPAVQALAFGENLGFALGNNRAAAEARTPYLVFLNADILIHRGFLAAFVRTLERSPDVAACQANMLVPGHPEFAALDRYGHPKQAHVTDMTRWGFVEHRQLPMPDAVVPVRFVNGGCFALRRRLLADLRYLFDPRFFMYAEDLDLSLRLTALGCQMVMVPDAVAFHQHASGLLPRARDIVRAYRATRNRILAYYKTTPPAEFRRLLPGLVFGAPLKVFYIGGGTLRQTVLSAGMIPIVAAAAIAAMLASVRYREERAVWVGRRPPAPESVPAARSME